MDGIHTAKQLQRIQAVVLSGARQVGKTTLAQHVSNDVESLYQGLESPEDLIKLSDPTSYLKSNQNKLGILDEIKQAPDLLLVLRGGIDQNR